MAYKSREEIVGKRFTSVTNELKHKVSKISEWKWRSGFVRAVSTRDTSSVDFTVLVEFDDTGWKYREYIKVHEVFLEFLVEHTLSWVERTNTSDLVQGKWLALSYKPVVDKAGLFHHSKRPVEFLNDHCLSIVDEKDITFYKEGDELTVHTAKECPDVVRLVKAWADYQDGQKILLTTPTVLLGYRVEVYRTEGTTQWYTAVIKSYNHANKSLTLTDDTVLEEHNEDPALIQMHLIGDGVVDSILNGVDVGVAQRRRPRSTVTKQNSKDSSSVITACRGTVGHQSCSSGNQTKQINYSSTGSSTSSSPSVTTTTVTGAGKGSSAKPRAAVTDLTSSPSIISSEVSSINALGQQKNHRLISKFKSDPPPKAAKKAHLSKKLKKSVSEENLDSSNLHTCNVLVKRIVVKPSQITQSEDNIKPRQPRLREKLTLNKGSPHIIGDKDIDVINFDAKDIDGIHCDTKDIDIIHCDSKDIDVIHCDSKDIDVIHRDSILEISPQIILKDSFPNTGVSDSNELFSVKFESEKIKDKVKYSRETENLLIQGDDIKPKRSPQKVVELLEEHYNIIVCDKSLKPFISDSIATSTSSNVFIDSTSPSDSSKEVRQHSPSFQKCRTIDNLYPQTKTRIVGESDIVNEKLHSPPVFRETAQEKKIDNSRVTGSESSDYISDEDMHYKKQFVKAGTNNNSSPGSAHHFTISEGIDENRSLTDQLSKRTINNKYSLNGDLPKLDTVFATAVNKSSPNSLSSGPSAEIERSDSKTLTKTHDFSNVDRHSAFTCVQSSLSRSNPATPAAIDRTDSRASDSQVPMHISDDKLTGSRFDDVRSVRSSPGASPLVSDRHEAINPYRDPDLMRKNPVQSNVQNILEAHHKMSQSVFPSLHAHIPGASVSSSPSPTSFAGLPGLPARGLLSALPYTNSHQLSQPISHLAISHGYSMEAVVRAQQLAALQHQHLLGYTLGSAARISTPEALWHRKFPITSLPTPYLLQKGPDTLHSADIASALRRDHLLQIDLERRELERIEVERRERNRLEQELRDKERKEIERERQENEKAERDRLERERITRERLEKDRTDRERLEWDRKQNQDRVLDPEAAVDQHFAESLARLPSRQGIAMYPSITQGTGQGMIQKTEGHHGISPHGLSYHEKKIFEMKPEDQVKRETEPHLDDKKYINKTEPEKNPMYSGYPYGTGAYLPGSGLSQQGQKPYFNLYGYSSSHSTITPEQLSQRGLNPESRQIKEEVINKMSYSPLPSHSASSIHLNQAQLSKDIKREPQNSVIVKRDSNPQIKTENPIAAHSHCSLSSSSPRPPQPRPAHTPDRPLTSSASPASSMHAHHLHHSNGVPSGSNHPTTSHSTAFHSLETSRSQSPYKLTASQSQFQPLNFCKSSSTNKNKVLEQPQQQPPTVHSGYHSSVAQTPVLIPNSLAYKYSLIQQGLVPNPIYSHLGPSHSSGPLPQHSQAHHSEPSAHTSVVDSKPTRLSPSGSKRKTGSKDSNASNRKKQKGPSDVSGTSQSMSIPKSSPQVTTNLSSYTSINNSSTFTKPAITSVISLSPSLSVTANSQTSSGSGFHDSFKSFVENTVHSAYLQDEKKAQEEAEKERLMATQALPASNIPQLSSLERKLDNQTQPLSNGSLVTSPSALNQTELQASALDSYSSRIQDTINRVANNQLDTDSDTQSAPSPPIQIKHSDTNSPQSRNGNGSGHPHHMKKAWLQRHDEDKKSETPVPMHSEEDSNSSHSNTKDIICVENNSAPQADSAHGSKRASSPANVVVSLHNGNINDHNDDESTSSASEAEMQNSSKDLGSKKRGSSHKPGNGSLKKTRSEEEKDASSPSDSPNACVNNSNSNLNTGSNKTDIESQFKDNPQPINKEEQLYSSSMPSNNSTNLQLSKFLEKNHKVSVLASAMSTQSPHSEISNLSPALSENNTANISASSSSTTSKLNSKENKDKKRVIQTKELSKNNKKSSFNKPLVKMTVSILKKTMMPFIQDGPCSEITPKLNKCRECKMTPVQRSKKQPNIFCRFYAFRRLKYNSKGIVTIHGFSELSDADPDDIEPWLPRFPVEDPVLDVENSKFIIAKVGDKFCELVEQEKEAKSWAGDNVSIVWKRAVQGVREMCDVCDTTLFNMHWVCQKCGFVVCLDCYQLRMKEGNNSLTDDKWLTCSSNRQAHKASEMMLTQIIPSDALWELGRLIHDICIKWSIPSNCPCGGNKIENKIISKNGIKQQHAASDRKFSSGYNSDDSGSKKSRKNPDSNPLKSLDTYNPDTTSSPLSILADVASMEPDSNREKVDVKRKGDKAVTREDELMDESEKKSGCSTLRELLTKTAGKLKSTNDKRAKKGSTFDTLDNIIQSVVEKSCTDGGAPFKFLHYTPRLGGWKRELPIMVHNLTETSVLYPDVPHSWLCDGRLLRLHDSHHKGNLQIFQEQWKRGQPVVVSCANKKMNNNIWKPEMFSREFGHIENEVVNCRSGDVIIGHTMGDFWDGFENLANRLTDDNDEPMLLKLKDWPPGDDFSELLPSRFQDLMNALPLPEYTQRNGKLNLASRLPDFLVRPDLGPKMYNAYGSSQFPKEGTTNLHLDISDAVNVMVYVGIPGDGPGGRKAQEEAAVKAIDDAGCDSITKRRVREVHEIPGALWHIYDAHDADKIRDFLNKVAKERGEIIEKDHDAIHDQSWYLDKVLCDRLHREYGVQGYTIVQCLGDAVFIPAGAPHQVRNLHSCIKVAEDFVSPEHLNHCFRLTQEFRQLSETHSNHEDKLQVKNIIYHAVKDAIAVLRENNPEDD